MKNKNTEQSLQLAICKYISLQYPSVIFFSDLSGIKMSIGLAVKVSKMKSSRGIPDLIILEPKKMLHGGIIYGLCIELKKDRNELYRKDGTLRQDKHILEQLTMLNSLHCKGYRAEWGCGFDETKKIIDNYLAK